MVWLTGDTCHSHAAYRYSHPWVHAPVSSVFRRSRVQLSCRNTCHYVQPGAYARKKANVNAIGVERREESRISVQSLILQRSNYVCLRGRYYISLRFTPFPFCMARLHAPLEIKAMCSLFNRHLGAILHKLCLHAIIFYTSLGATHLLRKCRIKCFKYYLYTEKNTVIIINIL